MSRSTPSPKPVPTDETSTAPAATVTDGPPQPDPADVQADPKDVQPSPADVQPEPAPTVKGSGAPDPDGAHYRVGYFGKLPDADNRPDLTLAGVIGQTTDGSTTVDADTDTTQEK